MTKTLMNTVSLFALAAAGCTSLPDDVGQTTESLTGAVNYGGDCTTTDKSFIDASMVLGRTASVSPSFSACLARAVQQRSTVTFPRSGITVGKYMTCSGDPFLDQSQAMQYRDALMVTHSPNAMSVDCENGGGVASSSQAASGSVWRNDAEAYNWSTWLRNVETQPAYQDQAAAAIWHEAFHVHGYHHGLNTPSEDPGDGGVAACGLPSGTTGFNFQINTMNYIVQNCMKGSIDEGRANCASNTCPLHGLPMPVGLDASGNALPQCTCVADPGRWGSDLVTLYNANTGGGAIGNLDVAASYHNLGYPGYATGWSHIVALPNNRRLLYNTANGTGAVTQYDEHGGASTLKTLSGFATGWTHVVSLPTENVVFYNASSGLLAIGFVLDDGTFVTTQTVNTGFAGATALASAGFDSILLYRASTGSVLTMRTPHDGSAVVQKTLSGFGTGFDRVVGTGEGRVLFYTTSTGAYATGTIAGDGSYSSLQPSGAMSATGWTVTSTMADGHILLFAPSRGELAMTRIDPSGVLYTDGLTSGFGGWTHVVGTR